MLLSIVMMVKNEEKFLEKTLKSFDKIRNNIESELIILDTGSVDKTLNIARKFTKNVYIHEWNDDFSDMRNKSISYANGEWILVVDADEELYECDELIKFFEDNEYKKFNSAYITLNNITQHNNENMFKVPRLFKKDGLKYKGIIHEQPNYKKPIKATLATFNHYGYMYDDQKETNRKLKRNEKLIIKELQKNPNDIYMNYQLGKNLMCESKSNDALIYLNRANDLANKSELFHPYVKTALCTILLKLGRYNDLNNICNEYLLQDKTNLDMYYYLSIAQYHQGEFKKTIKTIRKYINLYKNCDIRSVLIDELVFYNTKSLNNAYYLLIKIYNLKQNYSGIIEVFEEVDIDTSVNCCENLCNALKNENKIEDILIYYEKLKEDKINKNKFYVKLEAFIKSIQENEKNKLYTLFSNGEDNYSYLNSTRLGLKFDFEKIKSILETENNYVYGIFLNIVLNKKYDLIKLFSKIQSTDIEQYIMYAIDNNKNVVIDLYEYITNIRVNLDKENLRINSIIAKVLVYNDGLSLDKYKEVFYIYNMYRYKQIKYLYGETSNDEIIKNSSTKDEKFNIILRELIEFKDKSSSRYIEQLRSVLGKYPEYNKIIKLLIEEASDFTDKTSEYYILKNQFLNIIKKFIEENKITDAEKLIKEYYEINGEDSDILNIEGVLYILKDNIKMANKKLCKALSLNIGNEDILYNIDYLNQI